MQQQYTAVIKQDGDWWIGWIEEVPGVNCQERSKEELLASLREVLSEALEFKRLLMDSGPLWLGWPCGRRIGQARGVATEEPSC